MFKPAVILVLIISFLDVALALYILLKNPREKVNRSFTLFSLFGLIWINAVIFQDELVNINGRYYLLQSDYASGLFAACFLFFFCLDVSKTRLLSSRSSRLSILAIPVVLTLLIFADRSVLSGYAIIANTISPQFGNLYPLYVLCLGLALLLAPTALILKYKQSLPEDKAKFIYLFIGFSLSLFIIFVTNVLLNDYLRNTADYELYSRFGSFSTILIIFSSGYAIARHRLLNVKVIAADLVSLGILLFTLIQFLLSRDMAQLAENGIAFLILLVFIVMLVRSVESEVKRKEELQVLTDQLTIANAKLQELDNARAEFMSIASHQIQTPLTAIKGYVSLVLEDPKHELGDESKAMLQKALIGAERIIELIHDFLSFSRIESGKMEYSFSQCHVETICQEIIDTLAIKAKEKNLTLIFEKPKESLPELMIDGPKVREVISNLVDNAIKYTDQGKVTVTLETRNIGGSTSVRITVIDSGIGIPRSELPFLFEKFSRGKDLSRLHAAGTGLGLYVGKSMIEQNGGRIWAESEGEGKGSRFIVEIPIEQDK